jgi:hypothetical protein
MMMTIAKNDDGKGGIGSPPSKKISTDEAADGWSPNKDHRIYGDDTEPDSAAKTSDTDRAHRSGAEALGPKANGIAIARSGRGAEQRTKTDGARRS